MGEMTENNDLPEQLPEQSPEQKKPELPGKRLREAREAAGVSREWVASQLRLHIRLITALEEDDYDALPGQTFTTGYLRNYARLLELPEDSFVAPAKTQYEEPPLVSTSASVREISSRDGVALIATFVIIGVMIVSVAMWWLGRQETIEPLENATTAEIAEPQTAPQTAPLSEGEPTDEESLPGSISGVAQSDTETAPEPAPEAASPEGDQVEGEAAVVTEQTEAVTPPAAVAPVTVAPEAPPAPPPLTDDMPQSKLELRFEADSWTEVKDNAGRQLLYRLIKAGEVLVVRGEAPFHVFLGYAPGVMVYYNDELFDHSAFQRRDVARFRIGRAEHNHPLSR